jgi:hypothetical protein
MSRKNIITFYLDMTIKICDTFHRSNVLTAETGAESMQTIRATSAGDLRRADLSQRIVRVIQHFHIGATEADARNATDGARMSSSVTFENVDVAPEDEGTAAIYWGLAAHAAGNSMARLLFPLADDPVVVLGGLEVVRARVSNTDMQCWTHRSSLVADHALYPILPPTQVFTCVECRQPLYLVSCGVILADSFDLYTLRTLPR